MVENVNVPASYDLFVSDIYQLMDLTIADTEKFRPLKNDDERRLAHQVAYNAFYYAFKVGFEIGTRAEKKRKKTAVS